MQCVYLTYQYFFTLLFYQAPLILTNISCSYYCFFLYLFLFLYLCLYFLMVLL